MKTNNYIGRHDENRGIILFCLVFGILIAIVLGISLASNLNKDKTKGASSADGIATIIEKQIYDINEFKIDDGKLILEGELKDKVSDSIVTKLQDIELVLKDKDGDKYVFDTDYFIATDRIEFSSITKNSDESSINLDDIKKGEYFVLLRIKYESTKTDEGYKYRYYSLKNNTENNNVEYQEMNIYFDSSDSVSSYLTIEKK
ncbi:MAG: hypothetical protein ACI4ON_07120 [Clostridia bacterium]